MKRSVLWSPTTGGRCYPFGLREKKAEVLLHVGRWPELEEMYRRDYDQAKAADLRGTQAWILMRHGELLGWRNHNKRAQVLLAEALDIFREQGSGEGQAQCENGLAVVCIVLKEYDRAEGLIAGAEGYARAHDHKEMLCWLLNSHAVLCRSRGLLDQAVGFLEEKLAVSRELGSVGEIASAHMNLAVLYTERDQYDLALEHNSSALALSHRTGDIVQQHYALFNQAHMLRQLGRHAECMDFLRKALLISRHLGDEQTEQQILRDIGAVNEHISKTKDGP
jgi:tetratricopeptide (TPR) repeat protein